MEDLVKTIDWDPRKHVLKIGKKSFKISPKFFPIIGNKKVAYLLANEKEFIKVIKTTNPSHKETFLAMQQTFDGQKILKEYNIPTPKISQFDPSGPPYRYFIQAAIPQGSISAAELIKNQSLTEKDIKQIAEIVNKFELKEEWQIDTNPFNWYRANNEMTYVDGKVYPFEEKWQFKNVGLLQWTDAKYILGLRNKSAKIPTDQETQSFTANWKRTNHEQTKWWKKYLDLKLQP